MHESYEPTPCPECGGNDREDWQGECGHCRGSGLMDPDGAVSPPPIPLHRCPRCRGPAEYRMSDQARHCRACDETFYHAAGWPDILDWIEED